MKSIRSTWHRGKGWIIETPIALTPAQKQNAIVFMFNTNKDRYLSMSPGDRKDELGDALMDLRKGLVTEQITKSEMILETPFAKL